MILQHFIEKFIQPNSLVRLHYKIKGGYEEVLKLDMEWRVKNGKFSDREVIGVASIYYDRSPYPEAINIVISRKDNITLKRKIEKWLTVLSMHWNFGKITPDMSYGTTQTM